MKTTLPEQTTFDDATEADNLDNGIKAYKKSDYIQALELLYPILESRNLTFLVLTFPLLPTLIIQHEFKRYIRKPIKNTIT
jgi:hypothetical protein